MQVGASRISLLLIVEPGMEGTVSVLLERLVFCRLTHPCYLLNSWCLSIPCATLYLVSTLYLLPPLYLLFALYLLPTLYLLSTLYLSHYTWHLCYSWCLPYTWHLPYIWNMPWSLSKWSRCILVKSKEWSFLCGSLCSWANWKPER